MIDESSINPGDLSDIDEDEIPQSEGLIKLPQLDQTPQPPLNILNRTEWGAEPASRPLDLLWHPVPYVVLEENTGVKSCFTREECTKAMRFIQGRHKNELGEPDIQYNFLLGEDGNVYEGRGWDFMPTKSLKAPMLCSHRYYIGFIGSHSSEAPNVKLFQMVKQLLRFGIDKEYIRVDYNLLKVKDFKDVYKYVITA